MPEGVRERIVCLVACIAIAMLAFLTIPMWQRYAVLEQSASSVSTVPPAGSERSPGTAGSANLATSRGIADVPGDRRRGGALAHTLTLSAAGGDCWLLVRSGDARGRVLYSGVLSSGQSVEVNGPAFWIRLGAGQNVRALFDGRPASGIPPGTATVTLADGAADVLESG